VEAAADALDAAVDELDDEHAAVTPSSNTAAAPAAGTDTDRFIPAPCNLAETHWVDGAATMSPVSRNTSLVVFPGRVVLPVGIYRF
jgi:hypothetical protein